MQHPNTKTVYDEDKKKLELFVFLIHTFSNYFQIILKKREKEKHFSQEIPS